MISHSDGRGVGQLPVLLTVTQLIGHLTLLTEEWTNLVVMLVLGL